MEASEKPIMNITPRMEGILGGLAGLDTFENPYRVHNYFDPYQSEREAWDQGRWIGERLATLAREDALIQDAVREATNNG